MSREHMLYENKALQSIPVKVTNWTNVNGWQPNEIFQLKSKNHGLLGEGLLLGKSRHLIVGNGNQKFHYMVFHVDVRRGCKRKFDGNGQEIEPDFGSKQKVNTGYLMSSYKDVSKEGKDVLAFKDIKDFLRTDELEKLTKEKEDSFNRHQVVSLWALESDFVGMEFPDGAEIRFRTRGGKVYLESLTCIESGTKNLTSYTSGNPLGGSWTDKVLGSKEPGDESVKLEAIADAGDAAADDEWDE